MSEPAAANLQISSALSELLNQLAASMVATKDLVQRVWQQAQSEGLEPRQVREMLVLALKKRQLSDRSIRAYLPVELKDAHMATVRSRPNRQLSVATIATNPTGESDLQTQNKELQDKNRELAARINELQEALDSINAGLVSADKMASVPYDVTIHPDFYANIFAGIQQHVAAIVIHVDSGKAVGVEWLCDRLSNAPA